MYHVMKVFFFHFCLFCFVLVFVCLFVFVVVCLFVYVRALVT